MSRIHEPHDRARLPGNSDVQLPILTYSWPGLGSAQLPCFVWFASIISDTYMAVHIHSK
eukprot:COSAG01_NODE_47949_length_385_cov_1.433566_1_plen_58_part_10